MACPMLQGASMTTYSRLALLLAALVIAPACAATQDEEPDTVSGEDELRLFPSKPAERPVLPANYDGLSALQKQKLLGAMIREGQYCAKDDRAVDCLAKLPTGGIGYLASAVPALFSLKPTFNFSSDEAPEGRKKIFHPFGVAGEAELTLDYADRPSDASVHRAAPYSGVLANGGKAIPLILRMAPGGGGNLIPGASVKFLIDGQPSRNFVAIHDFGGLPKNNWNYFTQDIGHIYPDVPFLIKKYFETVTRDPSHLPITHLGEMSPSGAAVPAAQQSTPYEIVLRGNPAVATRFPNTDQHDFRFDLTRIEPGTAVYDVMARATETDKTFEKLGTIRTKTALVASAGGDKQLYFKHPGAK
ncbi:hypothetical protein BH11MYX4_BH11MYX4_23550 [soil metagenome]